MNGNGAKPVIRHENKVPETEHQLRSNPPANGLGWDSHFQRVVKPRGGHVLIDARNTNYIDPDIRELIEDCCQKTSAAHGVRLSMVGFKDDYQFDDHIQYVDYTSRDVQNNLTPERVLKILLDGNERFLSGVQAGFRIPGFKKFFLNNLQA